MKILTTTANQNDDIDKNNNELDIIFVDILS